MAIKIQICLHDICSSAVSGAFPIGFIGRKRSPAGRSKFNIAMRVCDKHSRLGAVTYHYWQFKAPQVPELSTVVVQRYLLLIVCDKTDFSLRFLGRLQYIASHHKRAQDFSLGWAGG